MTQYSRVQHPTERGVWNPHNIEQDLRDTNGVEGKADDQAVRAPEMGLHDRTNDEDEKSRIELQPIREPGAERIG